MTFLELQNKLASLCLDSRSNWIAWWENNKNAINDWLKEVFQKFINTIEWQKLMKTAKTKISLVEWTWNLPTDFYSLAQIEESNWVFLKYLGWYTNSSLDSFVRYWTPYTITFNVQPIQEVYIEYIKNINKLTADIDIPNIPEILHDCIPDFALVEYFKQQRDWNNVSASMQLAEWKMQEKITQLWFN